MKIITVQYINFWNDKNNDRWLLKFIKFIYKDVFLVKEVKNKNKCDITISSISGKIDTIKKYNAKLKIFYYGENLNRFKPYNNLKKLKENFDLIIGFLPTNIEQKLIRFPLWFMYYPFYKMTKDENNIIDFIQNERKKNIKLEKKYFSSCITRHSRLGIRKFICNKVSKSGKVMYPGKWRQNCRIGPNINHKINFLKQVKFNICPENSKFPEYFTEKIFHALEAGCVPIYWGVDFPEQDIINKDCYKFINIENKDLSNKQIKEVLENYDNYLKKNIFTPNAKEITRKYYQILEENIKKFFL